MHFPIIEILSEGQERGEYSHMYEDATLNYFTDYYGEEYTEEDRKDTIKSEWLEEFFEGIAKVDPEKETITFLSNTEIANTLHRYYFDLLERLAEVKTGVCMLFYQLRLAGTEYRDNPVMFWKDGCGHTSMGFIEDATFYAGQTFKIGNIYDAHY